LYPVPVAFTLYRWSRPRGHAGIELPRQALSTPAPAMESPPPPPARLAYILCELKSRDLESGLLIAKRLLARGIPVVFGQRWSIVENLVRGAPRGAVLFRTCNVLQLVDIERCADHVVIAMDEEGLPFAGDAFLDNLDPRALRLSAVFCAQD